VRCVVVYASSCSGHSMTEITNVTQKVDRDICKAACLQTGNLGRKPAVLFRYEECNPAPYITPS
jgi:hypothetical protein